mmetsp:Transcript_20328/g.25087  ORF Transcript_20328/g.25087 Transcript_20328/m.25087 type:complete len:240 (-) Transcript_20328:170-889(-)
MVLGIVSFLGSSCSILEFRKVNCSTRFWRSRSSSCLAVASPLSRWPFTAEWVMPCSVRSRSMAATFSESSSTLCATLLLMPSISSSSFFIFSCFFSTNSSCSAAKNLRSSISCCAVMQAVSRRPRSAETSICCSDSSISKLSTRSNRESLGSVLSTRSLESSAFSFCMAFSTCTATCCSTSAASSFCWFSLASSSPWICSSICRIFCHSGFSRSSKTQRPREEARDRSKLSASTLPQAS